VQVARKHKKQIDIVGLTVPHLKAGVDLLAFVSDGAE